jgi:hypothetical protein
MIIDSGKYFTGKDIVNHLANVANSKHKNLRFADSVRIRFQASKTYANSLRQMYEWIDQSERFLTTDYPALRDAIYELNNHLTLCSHVVGHGLSIADNAVWATIRGNRVAQSLIQQSPIQTNALRWYIYVEETNPWFSETIAELTSFDSKARAAASAAGASYDTDLPNLEGPMVTLFSSRAFRISTHWPREGSFAKRLLCSQTCGNTHLPI